MRDLRQQFGLPLTLDGTVASHQPKARVAGVARPAPAGELPSADRADALFLRESLRAQSNRQRPPVEPFSAAWFEAAQRQRHDRQAPWLPRLLEFQRHEGEAVLALGSGLGSDWLEYAKNGSKVTVCCADAEQLDLVRLNFALRDLPGCVRQIDFPVLPLADDSFDVACVLSLPAGREAETVVEVYRVLRPGGKILAVLPARRNAVWWQRVLLPWTRLFGPQFKPDQRQRCFTAAELRREFDFFTEHRIHKRHLKRQELSALWRGLPTPLAERLMGRFLIWKAFKPVRAPLAQRTAA